MVSGLLGLAVTYYFDDAGNTKLHNILKYGLKLAGLALVAFGTTLPEASAALCLGLIAVELYAHLPHLRRRP